jgi:hypothetical protein
VIGTKDRFEELKARKDRFEHRVETLRKLAFKIMKRPNWQRSNCPKPPYHFAPAHNSLLAKRSANDIAGFALQDFPQTLTAPRSRMR